MKKIILMALITVIGTACATPRTRSSDPVMRIAIDADSIPSSMYVRLQHSLMESGKFIVVDRAMGFRAMAKEQERQHETTRFGSSEKYALWGRMYGVGGIVVATLQCGTKVSWWNRDTYHDCMENLTLINATTGEVMAASEQAVDVAERGVSPSWDDAVDTMIDKYPRTFATKQDLNQTIEYDSTLQDYRDNAVVAGSKPAQTPKGLSDRIQ